MNALDLSQKKKVAFVCSGGAVKAAAFHVGVAMALEQQGFCFLGGLQEGQLEGLPPDLSKTIRVYVGSSAGSLVTSLLAQGGNLKDLQASFKTDPEASGIPGLRYFEMLFPRVRRTRDFLSPENFILGMLRKRSIQSPFSTDGIARYLRQHIIRTDRFTDLQADLFIVGNVLNEPRKVVFGKYQSSLTDPDLSYRNDVAISDACAASMALPPLYHPYKIQLDGESVDFVDGEIREPLSEHVARDIGCDLIICSYTHQPIRYAPRRGSLASEGVFQVTLQMIYQAIEQKIHQVRDSRAREKLMIDRVRRFFKEKELPADLCEELVTEIEARTSYKSNVDYIYIHPRPTDVDMFLSPHFSLDRRKTEKIVKKGFLAGVLALKGLHIH